MQQAGPVSAAQWPHLQFTLPSPKPERVAGPHGSGCPSLKQGLSRRLWACWILLFLWSRPWSVLKKFLHVCGMWVALCPLPTMSRIDAEPHCVLKAISMRLEKKKGHSGHEALRILLQCFVEPTSAAGDTSPFCEGALVISQGLVWNSLQKPNCPHL